MAGDPESRSAFHLGKRGLHPAGLYLYGPATVLTLQMMVMVPGFTAHKAHDLVTALDALSPPLLDEAFEVPVNGGQARTALGHALPDLFHRQGPVRITQHTENALALGCLPHASGPQGR